jgi:hypothetical protein
LISAFYSDDLSSAFKKVSGTRLSLLIVPLSFFLLSKTATAFLKSQLYKFQIIFSLSSFILCILYLVYLPFLEAPQNPHFAFPSGFFFKSATEKIPFFHLEPVLFSFLIVLSFINTASLYSKKHFKLVHFLIISIFYMCILLVMVNKVALVFIALFGTWFVFSTLKKKSFKLVFIILILFSLLPLIQIPSIKYEIEEIQYFLEGNKRAKDDSTQKRYRIILSSLDLAKQVNPIIGTGIGDVQQELNDIYIQNKYKELLVKKFDPHNQFLSMFLGTGLIGLISLIIQLMILIILVINKRFIFGFWAVLLFILQMFTETLLERQVSVIIYSFSISVILFLPQNNPKN